MVKTCTRGRVAIPVRGHIRCMRMSKKRPRVTMKQCKMTGNQWVRGSKKRRGYCRSAPGTFTSGGSFAGRIANIMGAPPPTVEVPRSEYPEWLLNTGQPEFDYPRSNPLLPPRHLRPRYEDIPKAPKRGAIWVKNTREPGKRGNPSWSPTFDERVYL